MINNKKTSKNIIISFILLSLWNINSYAQNNFIWEVKDDNNNKIYLLGSIHLARADLYPLSPVIMKAYDESSAIAVEINIKNINQMELMEKMMLADGVVLEDLVSEESYLLIKEYFDKNSLPEILYQKLKPSAAVTLLTQLELINGGFSAEEGIDVFFINKAEERGIDILELESVEFQLQMFELFDKYSDAYISYSIEQMKSSTEQVEKMFDAWKKGHAEKMYELINTGNEHPDFDKIMTALLDDRNIGMAEKAEHFLSEGKTVFMIVGAAHLIGDEGIINILEQKGKYQIRQL